MTYPVRAAVACGLMAMIAACSGGGGGNSGGGNDQPSGPALSLSATGVTIPAAQAGAALPAAQTAVYISNSGSGTLAAPTAIADDAWLDASVVTSGAGYRLSLRPNTTALAPATYGTIVHVASAGASGSPRTVSVSWQVTAASTPVLVATPASLTFTGQVGDADPATQAVYLSNGGTGTLGTLGATDDAAWLTPSLAGTVVTVAVSLAGQTPGDKTGHVSITASSASNSPVSIPVTFHVLEPTLSVSTATLSFAAAPSGTPATQTRTITNSGTGTLGTVTATPSYTSGSGWITTASVTGTGNTQTLTVGVTAPAGVGTYDGAVTVASANTTNGSVQIPVHLVVSATPPAIHASPTSLTFTMTAGTNPASQGIAITNTGGGTLAAVTATPSYTTGSGWMSAVVTGSGNSQTVTVSIAGSPSAGSYSGSLSIASSGASNTPQPIPVSLTVNAGGGGTAGDGYLAVVDADLARQVDCSLISTYERSLQHASMAAFAPSLSSAVSAGRLAYSQAQATACIAAINAASCALLDWVDNQGGNPPAACDGILTGQVGNGSACRDDVECANGYCAYGNTCPGTCTAFKGNGDPCDPNAVTETCAAGLYCLPGMSGGSCTAAVPTGSAGQPCADRSPSCVQGAYCDINGTCQTKIAVSQPCSGAVAEQCVAGAACAGGTCRAYAGAGQSCATAPCLPGTYCASSSHLCVGYPVAGQDCTSAPFCGDGSLCLGSTTKTCGFLTVGQDCSTLGSGFGMCSDRTYCLGTTTKTCTAGTVAVGDTCSTYSGPGSSASTLCAAPASSGAYAGCAYNGTSFTCQQAIYICY